MDIKIKWWQKIYHRCNFINLKKTININDFAEHALRTHRCSICGEYNYKNNIHELIIDKEKLYNSLSLKEKYLYIIMFMFGKSGAKNMSIKKNLTDSQGNSFDFLTEDYLKTLLIEENISEKYIFEILSVYQEFINAKAKIINFVFENNFKFLSEKSYIKNPEEMGEYIYYDKIINKQVDIKELKIEMVGKIIDEFKRTQRRTRKIIVNIG